VDQALRGVAIVQDPAEAAFPDMIQNAMEYVEIDHIVSLSQMGALLAALAMGDGGSRWSDVEPAPGEVIPKWKGEK
jgi:hypothetical protein